MNERGQIFTLDMFFALTLTVILVSYSGLALEGARRQAEGYSLRYSLERTVNDAADVLVKSAGTPIDWNEDVGNLGTIGLADVSEGMPIQNTLDAGKLGWIRELCRANNWDPTKSEVQAIMALFGGSGNFEVKATDRGSLARVSEDFNLKTTLFGVEVEVKVDFKTDTINVEVKLKWDGKESVKVKESTDFVLVVEGGGLTVEVVAKARVVEIWYETTLWDIWPGWDVEDSSGAENSLEVAVVRRSIAMRGFGDVKSEARALKHVPGGGVGLERLLPIF